MRTITDHDDSHSDIDDDEPSQDTISTPTPEQTTPVADTDAPLHPAPRPTTPITNTRPTRSTRMPSRYGNVVSYLAGTGPPRASRVPDPENP